VSPARPVPPAVLPPVLAALAAVLLLGAAPPGPPSAAWTADPPQPRVGDRITARLTVTLPEGARPLWDGVTPDFGQLAAAPDEAAPPAPSEPGAGGRTFTLYADLPGDYRLPAVTVPYATADGASGSVSAAPLALTVAGAFDPAGTLPPPAPAKPPVTVPPPWGLYGAILGGVLLALGAALWWWRRRRPGEAPVPTVSAPPVPPDRAALARLAELDPAGLPPRAFYGALSEVARGYLEDRFGVPARARTTPETTALLNGREAPVGAPVAEWLAGWDLVKFARLDPPREEAGAALEAVRRWVLETAPSAPSAPPAGVAP
jgi:hypothetical protein